ncbi:hypothetical protein KCU65_g4758, partial [Aureobasidium melanogenum]
MATLQRSLRQEIELLRQRLDGLEPGMQVTFNKLRGQIQTLEQKIHAYAQQIHALEEQSRALAEQNGVLEQQTHTLEQQISALKGRDRVFEDQFQVIEEALRAKKSDAENLDELSLVNTTVVSESTSEDPDTELGLEILASEHSSRSGSTEFVPSSPLHQQTSIAPSANQNYTVWYENGTLMTDAPEHLLATQDWHDLLDTFAELRTFFAEKNVYWHLTNKTRVCVRNFVQRPGDTKSMRWTINSPGKFCCKRCLNTQRVCLKYNEESGRLEALPLPEKVRPEGAAFGIKWFVAQQPESSRKDGFKGLWVVN